MISKIILFDLRGSEYFLYDRNISFVDDYYVTTT